jgi:hypothetical protein
VSRHEKTSKLIEMAAETLRLHHPMTVRQIYYRLVSRQVIENTRSSCQSVSKALVAARREGLIPWRHIEDRLRKPRRVSLWSGLAAFAETAATAYRRNVWETRPVRVETWLEKDALSGIFEDALDHYGVTLNVGRGFDGWDSIHNAAERLGSEDVILYFGDFDPSGEDMVRSLRERLFDQGSNPEIVKCAVTLGDIERYELPADFTKPSDTRRAAFVARWGDISVELDCAAARGAEGTHRHRDRKPHGSCRARRSASDAGGRTPGAHPGPGFDWGQQVRTNKEDQTDVDWPPKRLSQF